jgi:hypothetical protein
MSDILTDDDFIDDKKSSVILSDSDFMEEPKKEEPGLLSKTVDKIKSIPGSLVEAGKDLFNYGKDTVTGKIPFDEQVERLGTAARGAADMALAPGFAAGQYLSGQEVDPRKPTQQIISAISEDSGNAAEAADNKYSGARTIGQAVTAGALPMRGLAEVGASAALGSMTGQAANTGKIDTNETLSDVAAGGVLPVAGKAISSAAGGINNMVKSRLAATAGGKGAQFVDNAENVNTAQHARNINDGLKQDIRNQSVKSAQEIESGLGGLRQKTNEAYGKLKQELETLDQPMLDPDASPSRIAYDKMKAALNDPEITDIDKSHIRQVMDKTFIKNPEARNVVETGLQPTKQSPNYDNMLQGQKPTFGVEEYDYTPGSTLGENLQTAVELKRNLGEKAFKDNPNADSIARTSSHKMKALQQDVANTVDQGFAKEGLTNSESLYNEALGAAKTEIPARNILRKKLGSKIPGEQNNTISADKVRTAMTRSDDSIKQKLMDRANVAGAGEGLTDIANKNRQIQQNQMLQSDWRRLNTPDNIVTSTLRELPIVGKALPVTAGNAIELYNTVKSVYNNSGLASAVRALTTGGRTLSRATIANLAAQHKVDPLELEQTIRENGN